MPQFEQVGVFSSLIFWSLLSFGLLLVLLKKFAFPPILQALEDREKKISTDISEAEKLREEGRQLKLTLEEELKKAHEKASTIVQLAYDESKKLQEKSLQETQAKVKHMQQETEREIQAMRQKLFSEIRDYAAELTIASTEKFLKKNLTDEASKKLVNESIDEVIRSMDQRKN
ncbi:MAG: F0F1 ATP synthase subunit B [Candidatus Nitrohelix vancouverensis]|uniref:ATP synthase subunit b n=1 Tax=Candidatus Nitrohelix vancouverensis TaxID=2705534 RepID=A0A7T0G3P1_9BACT|nr:MAG: F0F1 ATP synthase subunit B [Candidatus Nitrohelix vancouverensis]